MERIFQSPQLGPPRSPPLLLFANNIILLSASTRQALYRRYGRFFAEFLNNDSLVPLGLLALFTSVGLRYGFRSFALLSFSRKALRSCSPDKSQTFRRHAPHLAMQLSANDAKPIRHKKLFPSSLRYERRKGRNINRLSISCGFRHRLRPASPVVDCQCHGNLEFSGSQFRIEIVVTHSNILSSERSTGPRGSCFAAIRMLSYHHTHLTKS